MIVIETCVCMYLVGKYAYIINSSRLHVWNVWRSWCFDNVKKTKQFCGRLCVRDVFLILFFLFFDFAVDRKPVVGRPKSAFLWDQNKRGSGQQHRHVLTHARMHAHINAHASGYMWPKQAQQHVYVFYLRMFSHTRTYPSLRLSHPRVHINMRLETKQH